MTIDNEIARSIMMNSLDLLMIKSLDDARLIRNDDFSDDDTDYMPARAECIFIIIAALTNSDITPAESLDILINDPNCRDAFTTSDMRTPFSDLIDSKFPI